MIKFIDLKKDKWGNIFLQPIIEQIKSKGFNMTNNLISYLQTSENIWVYSGKEPLPSHSTIPIEDVDLSMRLQIKCRAPQGMPLTASTTP